METLILPVAAIWSGSWDLRGMNWQAGPKMETEEQEEMLEGELTASRFDLLSTSPCFLFCGCRSAPDAFT
jgi:hypothetical protein